MYTHVDGTFLFHQMQGWMKVSPSLKLDHAWPGVAWSGLVRPCQAWFVKFGQLPGQALK